MPGFLAENNACGQIILNLVSRGNAIISELLRMKDYIPQIYITNQKSEIQKYQNLIMDFTYFEIAEAQEAKIDNNQVLLDLDEQFRSNHIEIITRFYLLFESIHSYASDLTQFLGDLEAGIYIHQSLETIFMDVEGKQVLCESLYLYGVMLLLVDLYIKGIVREKILVSYYRYTPQSINARSSIDEICKLLRDTGLHTKKVQNYPEDYFGRIKISPIFVEMVIGRLRTDDIYSQLQLYPLPKHRNMALSNQAAMLYVCLYFSPSILHSQATTMREIVDKYFPDNFIISIYMGHTVNLIEVWDHFKAAKTALNNSLETSSLKNVSHKYGKNLLQSFKATGVLLTEGNLTKEKILRDMSSILTLLRECNITVKWLMLHLYSIPGKQEQIKRCKQIKELIISETKCDQIMIFKLLLNTAQLELTVRELYKSILSEKQNQWNELKSKSKKNIEEISEIFSENKSTARIKKNENLRKWFLEISKQIDLLEMDDQNSARKIVQLIQALEEVQEFHQLEANMQIVQFLTETRLDLHNMIETMSVKEDNLITLQIIGDISFAWELIDSYTSIMQLGIKKEPTLVIKLRAVFLKLASAMEIPLLRINQAHSKDLESVSEYYSRELEIYVRKVLQIIPEMMFGKMSRIMEMQTKVLKELPTRLDKDKIKDFAQLDERFEFAELTHLISVYGRGMRMMKTTLVGVVCLDPKKLLEDGIRNELVQHISQALHKELSFDSKSKGSELEQRLKALGIVMEGYKQAFEYIQDYLNINSLKIWQEEVTRIINYNVEQECNSFLRLTVHSWDSKYQSRIIPIPSYLSIDQGSKNFIGRLAREIIIVTNPKTTQYLDQRLAWYEMKTHKEILNRQILTSLTKAIEISGIVGLDKLFAFMIVTELQNIMSSLQKKNEERVNWQSMALNKTKEFESSSEIFNPNRLYQNFINRTSKPWSDVVKSILIVGQLQILRRLLAFHLNLSAKFNAKNLESSLQCLNRAILSDIKKHPEWMPKEDLLSTLSHYNNYAGIYNPYNGIYINAQQLDHSFLLFLLVFVHLKSLLYPTTPDNLAKKLLDPVDGYVFCLGIHTIIKQLHSDINESFIKHMSQYIMDIVYFHKSSKSVEICVEASTAMNFMDTYSMFSNTSSKLTKTHLPQEMIHL